MKVLVSDRNPMTAMGVASYFQHWDRATEIAVMTGSDWHPNAYARRDSNDSGDSWFDGENIRMLDEPGDVLAYQPELIINTDPNLAFMMNKIVEKLNKPFHFGCQNMSTILTKEAKMGLNLIRQGGLEVVDHLVFESKEKFLTWVATQDVVTTTEQMVEVDNFYEYFVPVNTNFFSIAQQMFGDQFVVRKYSQAVCEFGVIFSGNGFIGRPFMVKTQDNCLHLLQFGDQSEEFTNRILNKLSNVLEAIGFRGPLFLSYDVVQQKIARITSRPPQTFWLTFLAGLDQSVSKYLFSLSKGVKFNPEVRKAVYGYNYKQSSYAQSIFDADGLVVTDAIKQYWGGVGQQTFYIRWQSGFPICAPAGVLCSSQAASGFVTHSRIPSSLRSLPPFIVPNLPLLVGLFSYNQPPIPELPDAVECQEQNPPEPDLTPVEEIQEEVITNGVS